MEAEQIDKIANLLGEVSGMNLSPDNFKKIEVAERGLEALLSLFGEDFNRDGLWDTPFRFIKAIGEHMAGYSENVLHALTA